MLLTLLAIVTVAIIRVRNLFAVVVLFGAYSFLMASVMLVLDGVDVALTEAAVGAGVSTVLLLGALYLTKVEEAVSTVKNSLPLLVSIAAGVLLVWGTWDLPGFGLQETPVNSHVGEQYLERSYKETHIPNVVTAVLASYRGFDTLGEVTVVFTAAIGVLMLLSRRDEQSGKGGEDS